MAVRKTDKTNKTSYQGYRYPSNVGEGSFSSCIMFSEFARTSNNSSFPTNSIILFMPERAANPSNINWESKETGVGVNAVSQMLNNNQTAAQSSDSSWFDKAKNIASNISQGGANAVGGAAFDFLKGVTEGATGKNIDLSFNEALGITTRQVPNPYIEMLFKGVDFRNFDFEFKLYPHSKQEAETIYEIIKTFRAAAYPTADSVNAVNLGYPSEFEIEYLYNGTRNKYLNRFKRSVLTKVDVDYTAAGQWTMTRDGFPSQIDLSLTFSEIQILVSKDIKDDGY